MIYSLFLLVIILISTNYYFFSSKKKLVKNIKDLANDEYKIQLGKNQEITYLNKIKNNFFHEKSFFKKNF